MGKRPGPINIELTRNEVWTLRNLAHYYERSMGPFRFIIRATSRSEIRRRLRFVADESAVLSDFAEATHREMVNRELDEMAVAMTPRTLVAFWGRVLASLNTRRSRRHLSQTQIEQREVLAGKLADSALLLSRRNPNLFEEEIATRRPREVDWMRDQMRLRSEHVQ